MPLPHGPTFRTRGSHLLPPRQWTTWVLLIHYCPRRGLLGPRPPPLLPSYLSPPPTGRGFSPASTCVELNPGPTSGPATSPNIGYWATVFLANWALTPYFELDEDGPPDTGPDGGSQPQALRSWMYAVCGCCQSWIPLRPWGLRPLFHHVSTCAQLHAATGGGAQLSTCGDVELNPGPRSGPLLPFAAHHVPRTGPGHSLLSCGDVEANPGPPTPDTADGAPSQQSPLVRVGPLLCHQPPADWQDRASQDMAVDDPEPPSSSSSSPAPQPPTAFPLFTCPLQCGKGPWQTRGPLVSHVNRFHLPCLEYLSPLQPWLDSGCLRFCPVCRLIVTSRRPCHTCGWQPDPISPELPVSSGLPAADETLWLSVLTRPLP